MIRTTIFAAAAAALIGLAAPAPAQAAMANQGLGATTHSATETVQYYGHRRHSGYYSRHHHRRYYGPPRYRSYGYYPGYRRCVTVWNGYRYVRRCR